MMTTFIEMNDRGWRVVAGWDDEPKPAVQARPLYAPERCYACNQLAGYEFLVPVMSTNGLRPGPTLMWVAGHEQCVGSLGRAWNEQYRKNHEWDWVAEEVRNM